MPTLVDFESGKPDEDSTPPKVFTTKGVKPYILWKITHFYPEKGKRKKKVEKGIFENHF